MSREVIRKLREEPGAADDEAGGAGFPPGRERMPRTRFAFAALAVVISLGAGFSASNLMWQSQQRQDVRSVLDSAQTKAGEVRLPMLWQAYHEVSWVVHTVPESQEARDLQERIREKIVSAVLNRTRAEIRDEVDRQKRHQYSEFRDRGLSAWRHGHLEDAAGYLEIAHDTYPTGKLKRDLFHVYRSLIRTMERRGEHELVAAYTQRSRQLGYWRESERDIDPPRIFMDARINEKDGSEMLLVPDGLVEMGIKEGPPGEGPVHEVFVSAFYLDRREITNAQYRRFLLESGRPEPRYWRDSRFDRPEHPVVGVSFGDAAAYAAWAGKRLPTEAEWERAAKGGRQGPYPWGQEPPMARDLVRASFAGAPGPAAPARSRDLPESLGPARVGSFPRGVSDMGFEDMAGNVAEWVADWFDAGTYAASPRKDPKGPESGTERVIRGGSWADGPERITVHARGRLDPRSQESTVGFRCAADVE